VFIEIDPGRPVPIFSQIMEGVRLAVATGRLQAGSRIPSIRDLAVELRVNPNTVAKAYQELERSGMVEVRRGTGYFIANSDSQKITRERKQILESRIQELLSAALEMGFTPEQVEKVFEKMLKNINRR